MILGSFLDWLPRTNGLSFDVFGWLGLLVLITGAFLAFMAANEVFGLGVSLPDSIAGFSARQIVLADAIVMLMATLGAVTIDTGDPKIGLHLSWLGSAAATVGAAMALRSGDAPATTIAEA